MACDDDLVTLVRGLLAQVTAFDEADRPVQWVKAPESGCG